MNDAAIGRRRGGRLVHYGRALEVLEDRVVPSTGGEAAAENPPTLDGLGLPSLVDVPVSADLHVSNVLAELFGLQPPFSMFVPMPQFLTPAGTSTVTAGLLGPITFTNFQIDSEQLNQLAGNLSLPDGGTPYVSPYVQAITIQTSSTLDFVHFVFEPIAFELSGMSVVLSNVDMAMSFSDVPGSSLFTGPDGASAISIVSRGIDLFAWGLGAVLRKTEEIADNIASSDAFKDFTPSVPETIPVVRYQLPPTSIDDQSITVSIGSGAMVDVTATTGAAKLFGNLLARAMSFQSGGYTDLRTFLSRGLSDLVARTPREFQKEVSYNDYNNPYGTPRAAPFVYQARVGSFDAPENAPYPSVPYGAVIDLYVEPHTARVHITRVDESGVTPTDRRGQAPPGDQVPPGSRGGSGGPRAGSAGGAGGAKVQPTKDPRAEKEKERRSTKKDDDDTRLPPNLPELSRLYRRARYAHEEYRGSRGITSGAIGGATIRRRKKETEDKDAGREPAPRKWDEDPLPKVLPDIGLRDRDEPRSEFGGDAGDVALRPVPPSRPGFWGEELTIQILLMLTGLLECDYSETFA